MSVHASVALLYPDLLSSYMDNVFADASCQEQTSIITYFSNLSSVTNKLY